ncbi:Pal1-domain-containing protein [Acephala macrosclerotiorum]|nr:Pal1-domain-containing protein [Acephala macrosclerotiorum]
MTVQDNLTLNDKPPSSKNGMRPPPRSNTSDKPPPPYTLSSRSENVPPRGPPGHRPSRSQEEAMRARRHANQSSSSRPRPSQELDIFADPVEVSTKGGPKLRRNSDSSVMSGHRKPLDTEEEKKKHERRRRERKERREREAKDPKSRKPPKNLDLIDKLDVTSIYGTGLFHHDGPFDACNPHRNRQGSRRAPMQAFPKDSLNNVLGGGGPINKRPDHATFLGQQDEEAFKDYSKGGQGFNGYEPYDNGAIRPGPSKAEINVLSATTRVEPIHGEETLGLGTSTFLEGAPASRAALQRRESEQTSPTEGGLGRKKSLAQRIRGVNTRRDYGPSGRITSPEGVYSPEARTPGGTKAESNPFFEEFSKGDDSIKKDGGITIAEPERTGRARAPSSPRRGFGERLERRVTSDGNGDMPPSVAPKTGGGFLSRVKSLKGGPRKPRAEKPFPQAQDA